MSRAQTAPAPPTPSDIATRPTPAGWPSDGSDRRSSKQMRVHVVTHDAVASIAIADHNRAWVDELDIVVHAGLKALGYPGLPSLTSSDGEQQT